jgi:hypothetical protein
MDNKLHNKIQGRTNEVVRYLYPLIQKIKINLTMTQERSETDKEELKNLKKEFAKMLNELIKEEKIHNIIIPNIGSIYDQNISGDTPVNLMLNIYTVLDSFYNASSWKLSSFLIQEKKQDILKTIEEEQKDIKSGAKNNNWKSLNEIIWISNLSWESYEQIRKHFNDNPYTTEKLHSIVLEIRYIKKNSDYILDSKAREYIDYINKCVEDLLANSRKDKEKELWESLGEIIWIPDISAENYDETLKKFSPKHYTIEAWEKTLTDIREIKKNMDML